MQHKTLWTQHNAVGQCILLAALMMTPLLAALMIIDMNGPDIEAVDEVKALILKIGNKRALDSESHRRGEEKTR